jgi:uncharacterized protein (TIGR04255 family)
MPRSNPFLDPSPAEVPLRRCPLVRVIAQVTFPTQLQLVERDTVSKLQQELTSLLPVLSESNSEVMLFNFQLNSQSGSFSPTTSKEIQWHFDHQEGPETYRLTVGTESVSLQTMRYTSRSEFFEMFESCLRAVHAVLPIPLMLRLGVRYIDRLPVNEIDLPTMVREELRGVSILGEFANDALSIHHFQCPTPNEDALIVGKVGVLAPGATTDPRIITPQADATWILDLDMMRQKVQMGAPPQVVPVPYDIQSTIDTAISFSRRIYTVFRWVLTDEFLRSRGGDV